MKKLGLILLMGVAVQVYGAARAPLGTKTVDVSHSELKGIGVESGVMRRDPSDVIKVGELYYVWDSKGSIAPRRLRIAAKASSRNGASRLREQRSRFLFLSAGLM